jgi:hypothetical protein
MMVPNDPIDVAEFDRRVGSIADQLAAVWTGSDALGPQRLGMVAGADKNRVFEDVLNQIYQDATTSEAASLGSKEEVREAALAARSALQNPSIRSSICRALGPLAGKSSREVTVELAKACVPLALTGQIAVPASPLVWGILGFAVAWVGATWLCRETDIS